MDYPSFQIPNVAVYARYSSAGQNDQSIDGQLAKCHEYAQQHGFRVVAEYCDRALSGRYAETRPEFQRMIADSAKHAFEYVLVWKLDRFSRDRYDSAIYKKKLRANGVRVLSVTEGIDEGNESILLEAILEAMAEEYSRQLAQNVRRGMQQNAEKGLSLGGLAPLGYDVVNKMYVVNEEEAKIIRFIHEQYAAGATQKTIVAACRARGFRAKRGNEITISAVSRILKNEKYTGIYRYRDEIILEGAIPAIVGKELKEIVKKRLAANARTPGHAKAKTEYLLHGKLFCGECGAPMVGECGKSSTGADHCYYACAVKKKAHSCKKRNERKDILENFVVDYINTHILTDEWVSAAADRVIAEYEKSYNASGIKPLENQIREADKELDKLVAALIKTSSAPALERINQQIEAVDLKKKALEDELASLRIASKVKLEKSDVVAWICQFRHGNLSDIDYKKRVIELFVNSIYVYDDKIKLFFNVGHDSAQITYNQLSALSETESSDLNLSGVPLRNDLWISGSRASAPASTAKVFFRSKP